MRSGCARGYASRLGRAELYHGRRNFPIVTFKSLSRNARHFAAPAAGQTAFLQLREHTPAARTNQRAKGPTHTSLAEGLGFLTNESRGL